MTASYADAYWLNLTNIALGVVCVVFILAVVTAVVADVRERRRERRRRRSLWYVLRNDRAPRRATTRPPAVG
jgi:hypothetical protein